MTILQEVQSLIQEQSEDSLEAIAVILRKMSNKPAAARGSIIGALKGKYSLPNNFLEKSVAMDEEISNEFYGECI